jgi:hypothetical protein
VAESDLVVDPDKLTVILAARLAAIVPDGLDVRAIDGTLWYSFYADRLPGPHRKYRGGPDISDEPVLACEPIPLAILQP